MNGVVFQMSATISVGNASVVEPRKLTGCATRWVLISR